LAPAPIKLQSVDWPDALTPYLYGDTWTPSNSPDLGLAALPERDFCLADVGESENARQQGETNLACDPAKVKSIGRIHGRRELPNAGLWESRAR
jgi:hypothetical protein